MAQEKRFEKKIKDFLDEKNCWYVKFFANAFTPSGIPDILACVNGHFVGIEVKAEKGKPSELQLYNQKLIRKAGGISIILYPEYFNDFKRIIEGLLQNDDNYELLVHTKYQYRFDRERY